MQATKPSIWWSPSWLTGLRSGRTTATILPFIGVWQRSSSLGRKQKQAPENRPKPAELIFRALRAFFVFVNMISLGTMTGRCHRGISFDFLSQGGPGCGNNNYLPDCIMDMVSGMYDYIQSRKKTSCRGCRTQECRVCRALPVYPWHHCFSLFLAIRKMDTVWNLNALVHRTIHVPLVLYDFRRKWTETAGI